jgi:hypothetical protein
MNPMPLQLPRYEQLKKGKSAGQKEAMSCEMRPCKGSGWPREAESIGQWTLLQLLRGNLVPLCPTQDEQERKRREQRGICVPMIPAS